MKTRNNKLDFIKGIATFLVLWGHVIQYSITDSSFYEDPMYRLIYSFHMPVFVAISGYLFLKSYHNNSFSTLLRKKFSCVLYPGIVWGAIQELMISIKVFPLRRSLSQIIIGVFTDVWFMWTLFWISVIVAIAWKLSFGRKPILALLLVIGGGLIYCMLNGEVNLFLYPFFLIGILYSKYEEKLKEILFKSSKIGLIGLFVFLLYDFSMYRLISVGGLYLSGKGTITNDLYRYFTGVVGVTVFVYLNSVLFDNMKSSGAIVQFVSNIANVSGELYCIQCIVVGEIGGWIIYKLREKVGHNILMANMFIFDLFLSPIIAYLLCKCFMVSISYMKKRRIYKVLFGGW